MLLIRFSTLLLLAILSGCANFNTIGRTSSLGGISNVRNTAIHLDAQQRVILSKADMTKVCAEPSPDVMAAYAVSLGLGANVPKMGGGSLAQGAQNSTAGIGLRTQSITLMRDALYRICEASMNDMIGPVHNATLLGRGMDLTAVVLAVEQLTGAVVASQPILTGSTDASASSSGSAMLHGNLQVLEQAKAFKIKQDSNLQEANNKLTEKGKEVDSQRITFSNVKVKRDKEKELASGISASTEQEYKSEQQKLKKLESEQKLLEKEVTSKKEMVQYAQENVEAIEKTRDSSLTQMSTNAIAGTSSSGQFNSVSTKNLHDNKEININEIAKAVQTMVNHALDKDYSIEACLAFLSTGNPDHQIRENCAGLMKAKLDLEKVKLAIKKKELD